MTSRIRTRPVRPASAAEDQRLLHDHADDRPVGRADQLERRDLLQLLHRHGVDDEGDHHGGYGEQDAEKQPDLAARPVHHGDQKQLLLLGLRQSRQMLPLAHRGGQQVDIGPRRHAGDDGGDTGGLHGVCTPRRLDARRGRVERRLKRQRIGQRHEHRGIAARIQRVLDEADHA